MLEYTGSLLSYVMILTVSIVRRVTVLGTGGFGIKGVMILGMCR